MTGSDVVVQSTGGLVRGRSGHRTSLAAAYRVRFIALRAIVGALLVYLLAQALFYLIDPNGRAIIESTDAQLYRAAGQRIIAGGPIYPAFQLAGPYSMDQRPELYPPPTVLLIITPMSFLPAILWWIVPIVATSIVLAWHRPSLVGWCAILTCLAWPTSGFVIAAGNPVLWASMFVALGTVWRGAAVLSLLKPSLAPFALVGVRSRGWWRVAAVYGVVGGAMLPLWLDWITLLENAGGLDVLYSVGHVPIMLIGLIAKATTKRSNALEPARLTSVAMPFAAVVQKT